MNKTLRFEIVTGINKGYINTNLKKDSIKLVGEIWQRIALEEYKSSNIYVSAVMRRSTTIYNIDWGCPIGGEDTVVITGVANYEFVDDIELWKKTVIKLANQLKEELQQVTMTCEFMESELYYLK